MWGAGTRAKGLSFGALVLATCWVTEAAGGTLEGAVFLDAGGDGALSEGQDRTLSGFELRPRRLAPGGPQPTRLRAVAGADGRYSLAADSLPAGRYDLAVFSDRGAFMGHSPSFEHDPVAPRTVADAPVAPTGVVYDVESGAPVPGARLWLYRSQPSGAPGELLTDEELSGDPTLPEQGQTTGAHGLYRFDMPPGVPLVLRVVYPGSAYVAPSRKRTPLEGVASGGPSAALPYPDPGPGADWRYYLRFDRLAGGTPVRHNHIPLDPTSRLLVPSVWASRTVLRSGDVVTWTVELSNRTGIDFVGPAEAETQAAGGGLFLQDALPQGFKYLPRSTRIEFRREDQVVRRSEADPAGATLLRFASMRRGKPEPLTLRSGETLRVRYQTVAGLGVRPGQRYRSRIRVVGASDEPLSPEVVTELRVESDPLFDEGLLLGKVFCDANANGWQDPGEKGLSGVRIYLDTGYSAATDAGGQLTFTRIPAGNHLVKLDTDTLGPASELLGPAAQVLSFTPGLPHKHTWPVRCGATVAPPVVLNPHLRRQAETALRARAIHLLGGVGLETLALDGKPLELLSAQLAADPSQGRGPVTLESDGRLATAGFALRTGAGGPTPLSWSLWLGAPGLGQGRELAAGPGAPPRRLVWRGRSSTGEVISLGPGATYALWIELAAAGGRWARSAPLPFRTAGGEDAVEETLRGELFAPGATHPTEKLRQHLERLRHTFVLPGRQVVVEVHEAGAGAPAEVLALSERRAARAAKEAARIWRVPESSCVGVGRGSSQPLVPNLGARNRWTNQRVVLRSEPAQMGGGAGPDGEQRAEVLADGKPVALAADGSLDASVLRPTDRALVIELRVADGSAFSVRLPSQDGAPDTRAGDASRAARSVRVRAAGSLSLGRIEVGGLRVRTPLLGIAAPRLETAPSGRLAGHLKAPAVRVRRWRVSVSARDGAPLHVAGGEGRPPRYLQLPEGLLSAQPDGGDVCLTFDVESADGSFGRNAPASRGRPAGGGGGAARRLQDRAHPVSSGGTRTGRARAAPGSQAERSRSTPMGVSRAPRS